MDRIRCGTKDVLRQSRAERDRTEAASRKGLGRNVGKVRPILLRRGIGCGGEGALQGRIRTFDKLSSQAAHTLRHTATESGDGIRQLEDVGHAGVSFKRASHEGFQAGVGRLARMAVEVLRQAKIRFNLDSNREVNGGGSSG